jgi:hypothetical protein
VNEKFKVDFIGIGPSKAGTTWIGHMLDAHPHISMAEPKEVHFFNDSISANGTYDRSHFPLGFDWYAQHFKHAKPGQLIGEVTPRYFFDPVVPKRIFEHNPNAKLIVCLRNPFERIVSQYHTIRDFHRAEPRPLSQALREDPEYIEASLNFKQVSRYLHYFSVDQFFFAEMDTIKDHPEEVVRRLYDFLGVDSTFIPSTIRNRSNPARATRSKLFRYLTTKIHRTMVSAGFSPLVRKMKSLGIGNFINQMNSRPIEKATLTEADRMFIREKIAADIEQFSQLVGKDYSHWLS